MCHIQSVYKRMQHIYTQVNVIPNVGVSLFLQSQTF